MNLILKSAFVLCAFAANSILCRLALQGGADPVTFTVIRVISAALVLATLLWIWQRRQPAEAATPATDWVATVALLTYLFGFSLAYLSLDAGLGALILFGFVQLTMLAPAVLKREPQIYQTLPGAFLALIGLVGLAWPNELQVSGSLSGFILMALAGAGWGVYSLRGRGQVNPLGTTTKSFAMASPVCLAIYAIAYSTGFSTLDIQTNHLILALASGMLASGIGYVVWYSVLPELKVGHAATVQLAVPVMAAVGGAFFIGETITLSLVLWGGVVLLGIILSMFPLPRLFPARFGRHG